LRDHFLFHICLGALLFFIGFVLVATLPLPGLSGGHRKNRLSVALRATMPLVCVYGSILARQSYTTGATSVNATGAPWPVRVPADWAPEARF
jgi:hypothetical protein